MWGVGVEAPLRERKVRGDSPSTHGEIAVLTFLFALQKLSELMFLRNGKKIHVQALDLLQQCVSRHLPPVEEPKFVRSSDLLPILTRAGERYAGKAPAECDASSEAGRGICGPGLQIRQMVFSARPEHRS